MNIIWGVFMDSTQVKTKCAMAILLLLFMAAPVWGFSDSQIRQFRKEVKEMNKTLPAMMSNEIQLSKVELRNNNEFVYVCKTTKYSANQINSKMVEYKLKPDAVNGICTTPETKNIVRQGMKFTYVYYDKSNRYISEYSITSKDCGH